MVKELFRDKDLTEFIIATIPTVLGINESRRLLTALRKEQIPCRRIIINQVCNSCSDGDVACMSTALRSEVAVLKHWHTASIAIPL